MRKTVDGTEMREEAKQNAFKRIKLHCNRRRMHSSMTTTPRATLSDMLPAEAYFPSRKL